MGRLYRGQQDDDAHGDEPDASILAGGYFFAKIEIGDKQADHKLGFAQAFSRELHFAGSLL